MLKLIMLVALLLATANSLLAQDMLTLYSARSEPYIKPLLLQFTQATNIKVNLVSDKEDKLLNRLMAEGMASPADILLTTDAGRLQQAKELNILQPVSSDYLIHEIPPQFRDNEGYWYGLSMRARPIIYNTSRVDPSEIANYEDLGSEKWKGRVCMRKVHIYNLSLIASMVITNGTAETSFWVKGIVSNFARPPQGGDRDQIKAVAQGVCDLTVANSYYYGAMLDSDDSEEKQAAQDTAILWPNQNGRGVHVNISGAGLTRATKNRAAAIQLLEFLVKDDIQQWYAEKNYEYPIKSGLAYSKSLRNLGQFKADNLSLDLLGDFNPTAVRLMKNAKW